MTTLQEGMKAPAFKLAADDGTFLSLKDYRGKNWFFIFTRRTTPPAAQPKPAPLTTGCPPSKN